VSRVIGDSAGRFVIADIEARLVIAALVVEG